MILLIFYSIILILFLTYLIAEVVNLLYRRFRKYDFSYAHTQADLYYLILIPCLNEEKIIRHTLQDLSRFNFAGQIIVINDGSTDQSLREIQKVSDPRIRVVNRLFPFAQAGKGAALNQGLQRGLKELAQQPHDWQQVVVGVLDADGSLSPNAFQELDGYFADPTQHVAQLRVKIKAPLRKVLQVIQDVEFFTMIDAQQRLRMNTQAVGLSGNGQFFRLAPIVKQLGSQPWGNALLEDYELTLRMMLKKFHIGYLSQAWVEQQGLTKVSEFLRQRSRWVQGSLECWRYFPTVLQSSWLTLLQKGSIFIFLSQPLFNLTADLLVIILMVYSVWHLKHWWLLLVYFVISIILGLLITGTYVHDLQNTQSDFPAGRFLVWTPIATSYIYLILCLSIIRAFYRFLRKKSNWLKTRRYSEE